MVFISERDREEEGMQEQREGVKEGERKGMRKIRDFLEGED